MKNNRRQERKINLRGNKRKRREEEDKKRHGMTEKGKGTRKRKVGGRQKKG